MGIAVILFLFFISYEIKAQMARCKTLFILLSLYSASCVHGTAQTLLEAEEATLAHCSIISDGKYSGGKAVRLSESHARITFAFNAGVRGKYRVSVGGTGIGGEKMVNGAVNGTGCTFKVNTYGETEIGTFFMNEGDNAITLTPNWTWFAIDYVRIESDTVTLSFNLSATPVDSMATDAAREMYSFLFDNFGKKTISGMMTGDMASSYNSVTLHPDIQAVYKASGKYPALIGFDFMNATGIHEADEWNRNYTRECMKLAKDTYRRGGLPAFTWHWRDPSRGTGEFYTGKTDMDVTDAMRSDGSWDTSSALYKNIVKDIDAVAGLLLQLQQEGVACIFRPLHEASGGWFWWGRTGAEPFRKLYRLIYDEMVHVKGVHNVIWVWNAGTEDTEWNPGETFYDIVSADIYNADFDYSSNYPVFEKLKTLTHGKKIIALSENGPLPDIQKEVDEEAVWSWWMPWYQTWNGRFVDKTSKEEWRKCMSDSRVITLEDRSAGWQTP